MYTAHDDSLDLARDTRRDDEMLERIHYSGPRRTPIRIDPRHVVAMGQLAAKTYAAMGEEEFRADPEVINAGLGTRRPVEDR